MQPSLLFAAILGIVEGVTEFLPVSSTGHLRLVAYWMNVGGDREQAFEIFIQLGAILAVAWDFRSQLVADLLGARRPGPERRLLSGLVLAFVPAAAVGLVFHRAIERYLFSNASIAGALVVGGILILIVESRRLEPRTGSLEAISWRQALAVGCAQVIALFPGFSRSAATILGGVLVGMSRSVATEFSFYLAIPTIAAASLYSLARELPHLRSADAPYFAIGILMSFLSAAVVVRAFLAYVRGRTFRPFAWYRIAFGVLVFILISERR